MNSAVKTLRLILAAVCGCALGVTLRAACLLAFAGCAGVSDSPEPIATRPAPAGEQRGYQEYAKAPERQTLFHENRRIESQVP